MKPISLLSFVFFAGSMFSCNNSVTIPAKKPTEHKADQKSLITVKSNSNDFFTRMRLTGSDSIIGRMSGRQASIYLVLKYYNEIADTGFIESINAKYKSTPLIKGYGNVDVPKVRQFVNGDSGLPLSCQTHEKIKLKPVR
jgi:hypothetical protein